MITGRTDDKAEHQNTDAGQQLVEHTEMLINAQDMSKG